jgi:hypothetical protein
VRILQSYRQSLKILIARKEKSIKQALVKNQFIVLQKVEEFTLKEQNKKIEALEGKLKQQ